MKPEELRLFPRYPVSLPVEMHSMEMSFNAKKLPDLRFKSSTCDVSLGGVLVDLTQKTKGLDPLWHPLWFRERFFWLHVMGIPTIPEGIFAKVKAVRFVGEDMTHPKAVGLEFQDLVRPVMFQLKKFLDTIGK
jgi:hypothetical protein